MSQSPYFSDPDAQLMLEFLGGDKASFEKLMRKYYPRILNFIYRYVGIREIAEDLTQEVFIKVYHNARSYVPKAKFSTWLFTVARNVSLNELRSHKRKTVSMDESLETGENEVRPQWQDLAASDPSEDLAAKERASMVREAVARLPENQRVAVLLRRYEDFSYQEISQTMKISEKAVKSLLNRAKESLRNKLSGLLDA